MFKSLSQANLNPDDPTPSPLPASGCHLMSHMSYFSHPVAPKSIRAVSTPCTHPPTTKSMDSESWAASSRLPWLCHFFFFLQEGLGHFWVSGGAGVGGRCLDPLFHVLDQVCELLDWHLWRCPQTQCLVPRFCPQIKLRAEHSNEATIKENCLRRSKSLCWGGIL